MKKFLFIGALALVIALVATVRSHPMPIEERLVRIQAEDSLGELPGIENEPLELQAALLDMTDDELLFLKARAAYLRYPDMTRALFPLYGPEEEFQDVLRLYGEHVLPPIHYFLANPIGSIELMNNLADRYQSLKAYFGDGENPDATESPEAAGNAPLRPVERGWYAIGFIQHEGHDFLGQFVVDDQGEVKWIMTERVLENLNQFFASGIRNLEIRQRTGEEISAGDIGWASLDVLVGASTLKVLRLGRAIGVSSKGAARSTRSAALATRLVNGGRMMLKSARYARWPAVVGVGYLMVTNPGLISDLFAEVAEVLGYPAWAVQVVGWFLLLLPALYIGSWLYRAVARLTGWLTPGQ
ncbi:hypothetical protein SAMN05216429_102122 [Marinobacter persicus]|uniref:Uncharacterized protein n=1 Tax=Marinobacter persicus TaxID=930118 RepID=A0A1I3QU83_9GAMM|nr:hypothetical protein [Marinobacter persicus]GHD42963.1 hypothetical protein GCM10008110_06300 [Marinobacter persicus]SFJ37022.1 hypothetical protein SAMN05216429_102122 [Marinobacter persicus]